MAKAKVLNFGWPRRIYINCNPAGTKTAGVPVQFYSGPEDVREGLYPKQGDAAHRGAAKFFGPLIGVMLFFGAAGIGLGFLATVIGSYRTWFLERQVSPSQVLILGGTMCLFAGIIVALAVFRYEDGSAGNRPQEHGQSSLDPYGYDPYGIDD